MKKIIGIFSALILAAILVYRSEHLHRRGETAADKPQTEMVAQPPVAVRAVPMAKVQAFQIPPAAVSPAENEIMRRITRGDSTVFKLPSEQVEAFLLKNKTNAESLLAALNVTADPELLREAARRYPSNALILASVLGHDVFPEQRRQWIDQFKQVSSDNPLPNYLSAREYLKNQQPQQAFQELAEGSTKAHFNDYTTDRTQGLEELYLSSGHSISEAKALATFSVQEPMLPGLRDLAHELSTLEGQYAAGGDAGSATAIAKLGVGLASDIRNAGTKSLGTQMLGASAERDFLTGLNPNGTYDFVNQPIAERLAQLQADRKNAADESRLLNNWMSAATEPQLVSYFDRMRLYGEADALKWARTQMAE